MPLTDEQRALRRTGITSTDVAAVLGKNAYRRPIQVWADKMGLEHGEEEETEAALWGRVFEPGIAAEYARRTGASLHEPGTLRHHAARFSLALATPDRIAHGNGWQRVLEVKTAGYMMRGQWGAGDEIPTPYLLQVQWEMFVTGLREADVFAVIGGQDPRFHRIEYDAGLCEMVYERVAKWWRDHVVAQRQPTPDGTEQYDDCLAQRFPAERAPMLAPMEDAVAAYDRYWFIREQRERMERSEAQAAQSLKDMIGEHAGILGLVRWKRNADTRVVDWESVVINMMARYRGSVFADFIQETIDEHTVTREGARPFVPKRPKEE